MSKGEVYTTNDIPPGGSAGSVLTKYSDDSYEVYWDGEKAAMDIESDAVGFYKTNNIPPNGKEGQVLKKYSDNSYEVYWGDESEELKKASEVLDYVIDGSGDSGSDESLIEKANTLKESYDVILEAMPTIGEDKEPPNGIESLANRVKNATVILPDKTVKVSQNGNSIYKGDLVCITSEPEKIGDEIRIVNGGGKLLAVSDNSSTGRQSDYEESIAIVFTQDGSTWIKLAKWNAKSKQWGLGPSLLLVERELDSALCIRWEYRYNNEESSWPYFAVFYKEDGAGLVQFWETNAFDSSNPLLLSHRCTDIWTDEAPDNLCGAYTPSATIPKGDSFAMNIDQRNLITLAYAGSDGSFKVVGVYMKKDYDIDAGEIIYSAGIWAEKTIMPGEYKGTWMISGKHDDFVIVPSDGQQYTNNAWSITSGTEQGSVWITYPGEDGKRYILELWIVHDYTKYEDDDPPERVYKYEPGGCKSLIQDDYQSCGAGLFGLGIYGHYSIGPYFIGVVSRLSGPNQRSAIAVEGWAAGYQNQLTPLWFGEEDQNYSSNIGLLSVSKLGNYKELMAIGYSVEGKYKMFLLGGNIKVKTGGPQVEICDIGVAGVLAESHKGVALVFQRDDSIFLQQIGNKTVAVPVQESRYATAKAVTGGRPGQEIKVSMLNG